MTTYYARKEYVYSGGDAIFSIPFSYIKKDHIDVLINGESTENYTYLNTSQIRVTDTLAIGDKISIVRTTPIDDRMVVFSDTSILDKDTQNLAQEQTFNAVQEIYDNNEVFKIQTNTALEDNKQELLSIQSNFEDDVNKSISDISSSVDSANTAASSAVNLANNALATANQALDNSNTAITTANTANDKSDTAVEIANTANQTADSANTKADNAVELATSADTKSDNAVSTSNEAKEIAESARTTAEGIAGTAQNAFDTAADAVNSIQSAIEASEAAQKASENVTSTAQDAKDTADTALYKVNTTLEQVNTTLIKTNELAEQVEELPESIANLQDTKANIDLSNLSDTGQAIIDSKADKATTLSGYGITDSYTKTEADNKVVTKQDKLTAGTGIAISDDNVISNTGANTDLSNLSDTGEKRFEDITNSLANKADVTEIDGIWTGIDRTLASDVTYPTSSNINYNLSSILPDDDNIYELLLEGDATTGTTSGNYINLIIKTSTVDAGLSIISCRTRTGSTMQSNSSVMIPIGTDRILTVVAVSSYVGKFTLYLKAYRKVR
jgi:hypothetical protein